MNAAEYKRLTLNEMRARRWRTTERINLLNGSSIGKGVEVRIKDKHGGLTISTNPCPHCRCEIGVRKVRPAQVEEF